MAYPSSFSPRNYEFKVFSSFHGPDVRKTLLSHLREQFKRNGITIFDDEKIKRSEELAPSLRKAIRKSRISVVILSKEYASSSWCLDELVEILKCKKTMGQMVMTVFYGVDPSHVRKQSEDFGISFNKTCAIKTDEERQKWSKALTDVSNIAGEDFEKWDNEANMIKKIARDVSDKLNATPSWDFEGMVGIEAHLLKMLSLLHLHIKDEAMIVGISGPAGIGKTTIARALQSLLSHRFQLTCFMDLRGSCHSGLDDYGLQLDLQEQLLSKLLNQDGTRICHLGMVEERMCNHKVLIILDDVNDVKQLEALAKEPTWFGPGSRIVVTTENKDLLQQRGINNTYHVNFPSRKEALKILCRYAFEQSSPPHGFEGIAERITHLCGNLPLGLRVIGSSLFRKEMDEWGSTMKKLKTSLGRNIEDILKVGYESLDENEQTIFLHIAVFFNYKNGDLVKAMFDGSDLDVKSGLKILVNRSLIEISRYGETIEMHKLLQLVGRQAIQRQEPWERRILIEAQEICDVLENDTGTSAVSGISFDISRIDEVSISARAFKRMRNLRFLRVYGRRFDGNCIMLIPDEIEFPRRLRLLRWDAYPNKCLPATIHLECLVQLDMRCSKLEKLWQGTQSLTNLKWVDLKCSSHLKELPDLSKAINLEGLDLNCCTSLVELPSSISNLQELSTLSMKGCTKLELIPTTWNLPSLHSVDITGTSITTFARTTRCGFLNLGENGKLKTLPQLPTDVLILDLSYSGIERFSNCCIRSLCFLSTLSLSGCRKLTQLPELPGSLQLLDADDCESLETIFCPLNSANAQFNFMNCFRLSEDARREIIEQRSFGDWSSRLPGSEMPAGFDHRAIGDTLTFPLSAFSSFKVCLVISPIEQDLPNFFSQSILSSDAQRLLIPCSRNQNFPHSPQMSKEAPVCISL